MYKTQQLKINENKNEEKNSCRRNNKNYICRFVFWLKVSVL